MKSERQFGIAQILLSGICFGLLGIFGKLAYAQGITPGEFLGFRFLIGGAFSAVLAVLTNPKALRLQPRQILICAALGAFGYATEALCFFYALQGLSASLTVLLLYTYPLLVSAGAWVLFGEKIRGKKLMALPLVMTGLLLLIYGDVQVFDPVAIAFGLGSALCYAAYILASSHYLKGVDSLAAATYIQLFAGIALSTLYLRDPARDGEIIRASWPILLGAGIICSAAAMGLFLAGLKKLKSWEVSVLSTSEPVSNIALAILLLGESLTALQFLGAFGILGAFVLVAS